MTLRMLAFSLPSTTPLSHTARTEPLSNVIHSLAPPNQAIFLHLKNFLTKTPYANLRFSGILCLPQQLHRPPDLSILICNVPLCHWLQGGKDVATFFMPIAHPNCSGWRSRLVYFIWVMYLEGGEDDSRLAALTAEDRVSPTPAGLARI